MIKNIEQIMSNGFGDLRVPCVKMLNELLHEIRADNIVRSTVEVRGNKLIVGGKAIEIKPKVYVVGFGKASAEMAAALEEMLGDRIIGGIINTNHFVKLRKIKVNVCPHPLPDENTVEKSKEIIRLLSHGDSDTLVIILLSGGASALFEVPREGVTIEEIREITQKMLAEGKSIEEINRVRIKLSAVKGGKLLRYIRPAKHITLVLSDVIGDARYVGSGPTFSEDNPFYFVLADNNYAKNIAKDIAGRMGYDAKLSDFILHGEPYYAAKEMYKEFENSEERVIIWGGETVVNVKDATGVGGRNQELSLYLAKLISGKRACFACVGTDGIDGPTDAAGGIVDGLTVHRLNDMGIDIDAILQSHDSYTALKKLGDLIITGYTGTNLADICIGLRN